MKHARYLDGDADAHLKRDLGLFQTPHHWLAVRAKRRALLLLATGIASRLPQP